MAVCPIPSRILTPTYGPVAQANSTLRRPLTLCNTSARCSLIFGTGKHAGALRVQATSDKGDVPAAAPEQSVQTEDRIGQVSGAVSSEPGPSSPGLLAGAAIALGVLAFAATRLGGAGPSLAQVVSSATPLEVALANGRPTVVEFYANYCEVCRELAPTTYQVGEAYRDRVNFVMLNVDNNKWAPEVAEYQVRGIPHFVFLDSKGNAQAAAVGKVPREVLERDVQALADGTTLPFKGVSRSMSALRGPDQAMAGPARQTMPKDHV